MEHMQRTEAPFRLDNTDGYDQDQIDTLNREWCRKGGPSVVEKSEADRLMERILADFDTRVAQAAAWGSSHDMCSCCDPAAEWFDGLHGHSCP